MTEHVSPPTWDYFPNNDFICIQVYIITNTYIIPSIFIKAIRKLHIMSMSEAGITNAGAYMRKMALNGYILHVDLAPVREMVSLQRRCSNNLNQVAVHAHTFGVYPEEIEGLKQDYARMWEMVSAVLGELSAIVEK